MGSSIYLLTLVLAAGLQDILIALCPSRGRDASAPQCDCCCGLLDVSSQARAQAGCAEKIGEELGSQSSG